MSMYFSYEEASRSSRILRLPYESLIKNPVATLSIINSFIGVDLPNSRLETSVEACSIEKVTKLEKGI